MTEEKYKRLSDLNANGKLLQLADIRAFIEEKKRRAAATIRDENKKK